MKRLMLGACLCCAVPLLAQARKAEPTPASKPPEPSKTAEANAPDPEDLIRQKAIPYRPSSSRDPFQAISDESGAQKGELVDEVAVMGRIVTHGKPMAVISDGTGKVRWLPVGYKFRDGRIAAIDDKAVTFHQWEVNSTNTSIYRTVIRTFKREEGKR